MSLFNENFYTDDFDQEMIDYVCNLGNYGFRSSKLKLSEKGIKYGKGNNYFWTDDGFFTNYKYLTKQQFKEKVGMTQKQFTKADLKDGMVVKYRGGSTFSESYGGLRVVLNSAYVSADSFFVLRNVSEDLLYPDECFSIDEVFEVVKIKGGLDRIENWTLKSIWKREEEKSAEQIEIESIQAEMDKLSQRLSELKGKV